MSLTHIFLYQRVFGLGIDLSVGEPTTGTLPAGLTVLRLVALLLMVRGGGIVQPICSIMKIL